MCSAKIVDLKNGLVYANKAKTMMRAYSQQQMHTMSEMKNSKVFMAYQFIGFFRQLIYTTLFSIYFHRVD